jgi:hypothetical protein
MFQDKVDSLFICQNCGEGFSIKKLESHVKESHFWNAKFDYYKK